MNSQQRDPAFMFLDRLAGIHAGPQSIDVLGDGKVVTDRIVAPSGAKRAASYRRTDELPHRRASRGAGSPAAQHTVVVKAPYCADGSLVESIRTVSAARARRRRGQGPAAPGHLRHRSDDHRDDRRERDEDDISTSPIKRGGAVVARDVRRHVHVRGHSVETELVALDVLHHKA
jgi:hypothetical protein